MCVLLNAKAIGHALYRLTKFHVSTYNSALDTMYCHAIDRSVHARTYTVHITEAQVVTSLFRPI
jgi:hypothetical protein